MLSHDDFCSGRIFFGKPLSHERVGTEIERGKSIVENENFGFSRESAGNGKSLFLSARKITPELSDLVVGFFRRTYPQTRLTAKRKERRLMFTRRAPPPSGSVGNADDMGKRLPH